MNIPNLLTIFRLLMIPIFIGLYTNGQVLASLGIYMIAGITDILDGYIARKYNMMTKLGAALDPLADKLMLITALACLSWSETIPIWVLKVVVFKEGAMVLGGIYMYFGKIKRVIPANIYGKAATFSFYIAVATSMLGEKGIHINVTLGVAVFLTVIALCNYIYLYFSAGYNTKKSME